MIKCILETKADRLELTLNANRFVLTKGHPIVLLLTEKDIKTVSVNKFITIQKMEKPVDEKPVAPIIKEVVVLDEKEKEVVIPEKKEEEIQSLKQEQQDKLREMLKPKNKSNKSKGKNKKK